MSIFDKEKDKEKEKETGVTDEPKSEKAVGKTKEVIKDGVEPEHDPKFAFLMRAIGSFDGELTQDFGYPVQTKVNQALIQHLTNYMENGSLEN